MSILIKDNQTGRIHEYGTDGHDALHISGDGSCLFYENLQNGDGSMCGGYSFVMEDGKTPEDSETADAMHAMCYFNIGGFKREQPTVEITEKQAISLLINSGWLVNHDKELRDKWERPQGEWVKSKDGYTRCDQCGSRGSAIKANFCHHCGADMRGDAE